MPWCPKCKMEYREGITICADCKTELVDELPQDAQDTNVELIRLDTEEHACKLIDFLAYSNIINTSYSYDEKDMSYIVYVDEKDIKEAKKLFNAFYIAETESDNSRSEQAIENQDTINNELLEDDVTDFDNNTIQNDMTEDSFDDGQFDDYDTTQRDFNSITKSFTPSNKKSASVYVKKSEQYRDVKSTGFIFIGLGVIGLAVILLNVFGVFNFYDNFFAWIVMGVLFTAFIFIGIGTLIHSTKIKSQIAEEDALTNAINEWLEKHITEDTLQSVVVDSEADEINYFKKVEFIKHSIFETFSKDLDDSYVDFIADEFYTTHFSD